MKWLLFLACFVIPPTVMFRIRLRDLSRSSSSFEQEKDGLLTDGLVKGFKFWVLGSLVGWAVFFSILSIWRFFQHDLPWFWSDNLIQLLMTLPFAYIVGFFPAWVVGMLVAWSGYDQKAFKYLYAFAALTGCFISAFPAWLLMARLDAFYLLGRSILTFGSCGSIAALVCTYVVYRKKQ